MKRLNLGPGGAWSEPGWENLDLDTGYDLTKRNLQEYADGSVDRIYTSHCIEHIEFAEAVKLLTACYRVLSPGGLIRIVVPDIDRLHVILTTQSQAYLELRNSHYYSKHRDVPFETHIKDLSGIDRFLEPARETMHRCFFSKSILSCLLRFIGFAGPRKVAFAMSYDPMFEVPANLNAAGMPVSGWDNPNTEFISLYMEAVK